MAENTINLNPDPLKDIEEALRTSGLWCDVYGETSVQHYYLAKNPKLDTAISLCGQSIKSFSDLVVTKPVKKCLVCDLFATSREEAATKREDIAQVKGNRKVSKNKYHQTTSIK